MSTGSQASRSGPIDSKRVCSTLKSRSLLPFLSSLSPLYHPASFHRHRSLAPPSSLSCPPPPSAPILCPSFSLVPFIRPFVCIGRKRCNGWTRSGKSEIPFSSDIKLYPLLLLLLLPPFFGLVLPLSSATSRQYFLRTNQPAQVNSTCRSIFKDPDESLGNRTFEYWCCVLLSFFLFLFLNPFPSPDCFNRYRLSLSIMVQ